MPVAEGADHELWDLVPQMIERGIMTAQQAATTIKDFNKPAGEKCPHQCSKGCRVYDRRPIACRFWSCSWIINMPGTEKMSRPDRSHYVINPVVDYVEANDERGHFKIPVMEIWCDPKFPDAWKDPRLLAYLVHQAEHSGYAALIRYDESDAQFVIPPPLSSDRAWHVRPRAKATGKSHTFEDKMAALGRPPVEIVFD